MGSIVTTVGNRRGKPIATLNAPSQDTGVILSTSPVTNAVTQAFVPGDLPMGYKNVQFQLIPGDMTAGSVEIDGTLDQATMLRLKSVAADLHDASGDDRLDAVMAEIDLRVAVELAKAGIS